MENTGKIFFLFQRWPLLCKLHMCAALTLIDFLVRWKLVWAGQIGLQRWQLWLRWSASFKQLGRSSKTHTHLISSSYWSSELLSFFFRHTLSIKGAPPQPLSSRLTKKFLPFLLVSIPLATRKCQYWSTQLSLAWFTSTTTSQIITV